MSIRHHPTRRDVLRTAAAAVGPGAIGLAPAFAADAYPSKPIRVIVPLTAGGALDAGVRLLAEGLRMVLKQPVIVENRPGALYVIGISALTSAPADGYTLLALNSSMTSVQAVSHKFDMLKQLALISKTSETPALLMVSAKSPFKTAADLVAHAKANPGKLTYGVAGPGSGEHLLNLAMERAHGFRGTMIPYKGSADATIALVGGEIDYQYAPGPLAAQFQARGAVRPLAVFSPKRAKEFPDVPTAAEAGIPVAPYTYWGGMAAVAGTPPAIVQALHRAIAEASADPEYVSKLQAMGASVALSESSEAYTRDTASEIERMVAAAKAGNIKLE